LKDKFMSKTIKFLILSLFLFSALNVGSNFVFAYDDCLNDPTAVPGYMYAPGYTWSLVSNTGANTSNQAEYCIWTGGYCDASAVGGTGVMDEIFGPSGSQVWQYSEYVCDIDLSSGPATINVVETPVSGGSWVIIPGNHTATTQTVSASASGTQYCLSVTSVPSGYSHLRTDNSQSGQNSSCLTAFPSNTYTFTIVYTGGSPPPPPTGLSTSPGSCNTGTIYVSWNSSSGATSYQLYRNGSLIYNDANTNYTDTGLTASQTYTYTVAASNGAGQSGQSSGVPGTAPATCGGPGSVDIEGSNNGSTFTDGPVYLGYVSGILQNFWYNWTSTNTTSCSIGAPVNSGVATNGSAGPLNSSHAHYPSVSGTTYTITCNVSGGGTTSDTLFAQRVPNAPSISATTGVSCGGTIVVNWTASTGATSYKLYRDGGGTPIYTGSSTTFTDTVAPNTAHYYTVVATNSAGDSLQSTSSGWITSSASCTPASVTISASPNPVTYGQSTTLTWSSQNVSSCSASANPSNAQWSGSKITSGNQTITNMTATTLFTISCTGIYGSVNADVTVTVLPAAPTGLSATAGACESGRIDLSWIASTGASSYSIHRSTTNGGPYMQIGSGITSTTYSDSNGLVPGTTYYYVVKAVSGSSVQSANSNQASAVAPAGSCTTSPTADLTGRKTGDPSFLQGPVTIPSGSTIDLSWTSTNATRCVATGGWWVGTYGPTGTLSGLGPLSSNATFGISCDTGPSTTAATDSVSFVIGTPQPDLTAGNITPTTAETGTPVTFTSTITNSGSASTGSSFNNHFQVATQLNGGGTVSTISVNSRAALSAGASGTVSSSPYTFSTPSSNYSVRVCSDQNQFGAGTITESNESNNCSAWTGVVVNAGAPSFDYNLTNAGNVSVTKTAGNATGNTTVFKTLVSGTTQSVDINLSGVPAGVSTSISNKTCSPTCQSVITLTIPDTTPIGTYPITVTGTPGNKTTNFNLIVSNPGSISASCSVSPSPVQVGKPVTWSVNVIGGSGSYTYAWTGDDLGSPGPTTASFQKTYQSTGIKSANVVVTDTVSSSTTSCPAGVLGQTQVQVQVNPVFEEF